MDVTTLIDPLNDAQRDAVTLEPAHALVLAGAGSGKTRVLVHRLAWSLTVFGYSPFDVLAVTFTNKAAAEMRARAEQLLNYPASGLWIGTFHSISLRILRQHASDAGLPTNFQILDSDDQQRFIKRLLNTLGIDENRWPAKQQQWFINNEKDALRRPDDMPANADPKLKKQYEIYAAYDDACRRAGLVDFAEILLRCYELVKNTPVIKQKYQQKFKTILVDEFQDTNQLQYEWLKLLAGDQSKLFMVGDDDQSIYGWRGARIENIQHFSRDFDHKTVRLEQNYRSTGNILTAANGLISHNGDRLGKTLWTNENDGDPIQLFSAANEVDEAKFVCQEIQKWLAHGNLRQDVAVLYRSNAQSRAIEETLVHAGMPYRVYGGLRFFDRAEIKDALGYLRLVLNSHDDAAFERVINTPVRGIGDKSVQMIRQLAMQEKRSLWDTAQHVVEHGLLSKRASNAIAAFITLIHNIADEIDQLPLPDQFDTAIEHSGLYAHYEKNKSEQSQTKLENLKELVSAAQNFHLDSEPSPHLMSDFLSHAVLESGEKQNGDEHDCVQLMSLHAAKGLEFPLVFICGMEEGLFPHAMSYEEPGRLDEERRLCYVGITRARQKLILTYAERRRLHGRENFNRPSQFIQQMPADVIEEVNGGNPFAAPSHNTDTGFTRSILQNESGWNLGQRVAHEKFGEGVITNVEGAGGGTRIQVQFANVGSKWLVASFARLSPI